MRIDDSKRLQEILIHMRLEHIFNPDANQSQRPNLFPQTVQTSESTSGRWPQPQSVATTDQDLADGPDVAVAEDNEEDLSSFSAKPNIGDEPSFAIDTDEPDPVPNTKAITEDTPTESHWDLSPDDSSESNESLPTIVKRIKNSEEGSDGAPGSQPVQQVMTRIGRAFLVMTLADEDFKSVNQAFDALQATIPERPLLLSESTDSADDDADNESMDYVEIDETSK